IQFTAPDLRRTQMFTTGGGDSPNPDSDMMLQGRAKSLLIWLICSLAVAVLAFIFWLGLQVNHLKTELKETKMQSSATIEPKPETSVSGAISSNRKFQNPESTFHSDGLNLPPVHSETYVSMAPPNHAPIPLDETLSKW